MARLGSWDLTGFRPTWWDVTGNLCGWMDRDLVPCTAAPPPPPPPPPPGPAAISVSPPLPRPGTGGARGQSAWPLFLDWVEKKRADWDLAPDASQAIVPTEDVPLYSEPPPEGPPPPAIVKVDTLHIDMAIVQVAPGSKRALIIPKNVAPFVVEAETIHIDQVIAPPEPEPTVEGPPEPKKKSSLARDLILAGVLLIGLAAVAIWRATQPPALPPKKKKRKKKRRR